MMRTVQLMVIFSTLLFLILPQGNATAQTGLRAVLSQPDLSRFPNVSLYLDVYDAQGKFISNLESRNFRLFEDGQQSTLNEVTRQEPGLHTIIALNLGLTLSNRPEELTRFEELTNALSDWLTEIQSNAENSYSLTTNDRALAQRFSTPQQLLGTLQDFQPNLFNYEANLSSLELALDVVAQDTESKGNSKQAIFYLTPILLDRDVERLTLVTSRAVELKVPVFVWLLAKETSINAPSTDALRRLADRSGGQFSLWAEKSTAPDPEEFLGALRYTYRLRYTSAINRSGFHTLNVEVERGVQQASSQNVNFQINLQAPQVAIIALPPQIQRVWVQAAGGRDRNLEPDVLTLQLGINFPDGYTRQLKYTRLLVDGQEILTITNPPFEFLAWPLDGYQSSGTHVVVVELEDILGLRTAGEPRQVQIFVEPRYPGVLGGVWNFIITGGYIALIVLSVLGLLMAFASLRRRLPRLLPSTAGEEPVDIFTDPLTQPVTFAEEELIYRPVKKIEPEQVSPYLVWADKEGAPAGCKNIRIPAGETRIGSDPQQANIVINFPSVEPVHAALRRAEEGSVTLADHGSKNGTWVNYAPISSKGTVLHNGDLVRIGDALFRYELRGLNKEYEIIPKE